MSGRALHAVCWVPSGWLFAGGGVLKGDAETNTLEMLEYSWREEKPPQHRKWRYVAPLLQPRHSLGLAFISGKLVAAGGRSTVSVEVLTLPSPGNPRGQWTEVRPFTSKHGLYGMLPFEGGFLAVGKTLTFCLKALIYTYYIRIDSLLT